MGKRSIVTMITLSSCGIVCALLLSAVTVLEWFEKEREQTFTGRYQKKISHSISDREKEEKALLKKNVQFNAEVLGRIAAGYLYDFDIYEVKKILPSYMHYPEIIAILVFNEKDKPVAAIWKAPEIKEADVLPDTFEKDDSLSVQADSFFEDKKTGRIKVWYTDKELVENISRVRKAAAEDADAFSRDSEKSLRNFLIWQRIGIFFIMLVLTIYLIIFLRKLVLKPLQMVSDTAYGLSDFDLTIRMEITRKDEIGRMLSAINAMIESLSEIVSTVSDMTGQVNSASVEILTALEDQTMTASQQSVSASEISAAISELSSSSTHIADYSESVALLADNSLEKSRHGAELIEKVMEKMNDIREDNKENIRAIVELGKKSEDIGKVMDIINAISDQTRLIAFNAALEAAGAGEYGKRFGVVADEIRHLAGIVTRSTADIESKLNEIQEAVHCILMNSEKGSKKIQEGVEYSGQMAVKLREIVDNVSSVTNASKEISLSTHQQKAASGQVFTAVKEIDKGAGQTLKAIKHISSISENLTELSADLHQLISIFKLNEED